MIDYVKYCREEADNTFYDPLKESWTMVGDHIEKLEKENGVLFAANVRLNSRIDLDFDHYRDRIEELEAALREISSVSKVYVPKGEDMAQALVTLLASHRKIALSALEEKND